MAAGHSGVEHISAEDLPALITRQIAAAAERGASHVRNPPAFEAHLLDVARRAEATATQLLAIVPADEAPDPCALFVAGAWHDGGKIWAGDDFHEITSAVDLLAHGHEWGLVRGPADAVDAVLRRAAGAMLAEFAVYEQWQPDYRPTFRPRAEFEPAYQWLGTVLCPGHTGDELDRRLLLPQRLDTLILMHSDFGDDFEGRWRDVEQRARRDDPALHGLLPAVKPRIREGCEVVRRLTTAGYDEAIVREFFRHFGGRSRGRFEGNRDALQSP